MRYKRWIVTLFVFIFIILMIVAGVNYYIDPQWAFNHSNRFNNVQTEYNTRVQKMNIVYFQDISKYDGILLGSSRTTYINQYDFKGMNIFNMSAENMFPREYSSYIDVFQKVKKKKLKYIIIGVDFFGSRVPEKRVYHKLAYFYYNQKREPFYRYKKLISFNLFKYSIRNIVNNYRVPNEYYDRKNIRYHLKLDRDRVIKNFNFTYNLEMEQFKKIYRYNNNYLKIMHELKDRYKDSKFIIFTTPATSKLLLGALKDAKRFNDYSRWLHELVRVFGKVYHFNDINSITSNLDNYFDDEHFYPQIGTLIVSKILNKDAKTPKDFGIILTKKNIDRYLKDLYNRYIKE